jgi:cytochrome c oxidase cbb3-type subunit 4
MLEKLLFDAHSLITLISFITFIGIIWWTYGLHRSSDFDAIARLAVDDEHDLSKKEHEHV